ncbi:hypothetical protein LOTGIDRAFT_167837 [Lottia gigantea]|uniref:THAP-type domain-containing protein n=1 Tax=Lottia gigantea TaxID=225164 RepID=V3ZWC6_LOTGI|nr:hypothetical protein LOTGIDRAFT_167837 [Lottia gigantea]ESO85261.1 hypothetical protein LOTGIDRAFT_167837 [Lottia gigantea]
MEEGDRHSEKRKSHGATRHCCYGTCNSDSRYSDREYMEGVFWVPFPKPKRKLEKCLRWLRACRREDFPVEKVTRWTYICSKHFVGENGPTNSHPDPIPATFTPKQVDKFSRKRKPPTPRSAPVSKKILLDVSEALVSLQNQPLPETWTVDDNTPTKNKNMCEPNKAVPVPVEDTKTVIYTVTSIHEVGTQTAFLCSDALSNKIERRLRKIEALQRSSPKKGHTRKKFDYDHLVANGKLFKFYTG